MTGFATILRQSHRASVDEHAPSVRAVGAAALEGQIDSLDRLPRRGGFPRGLSGSATYSAVHLRPIDKLAPQGSHPPDKNLLDW